MRDEAAVGEALATRRPWLSAVELGICIRNEYLAAGKLALSAECGKTISWN
jgi:hypothetical protein